MLGNMHLRWYKMLGFGIAIRHWVSVRNRCFLLSFSYPFKRGTRMKHHLHSWEGAFPGSLHHLQDRVQRSISTAES
jgi:hypothetical protein